MYTWKRVTKNSNKLPISSAISWVNSTRMHQQAAKCGMGVIDYCSSTFSLSLLLSLTSPFTDCFWHDISISLQNTEQLSLLKNDLLSISVLLFYSAIWTAETPFTLIWHKILNIHISPFFFVVKIIILSDGWDLSPHLLKKHRNLRIKKIILKCVIFNTSLIWKICCLFPVLNSFNHVGNIPWL